MYGFYAYTVLQVLSIWFSPLPISDSWSIPSSSGKTSGVSYCLEGKLPQPVLRGGMCLTRTYMQSGSPFLVQQLSFQTWPGSTSNSAGLRAPLLKIFLLLVTGSVTDLLPILNMWSGEDAVRRRKFKHMLHRVTKMVPCSSLLCWYVWQQWPRPRWVQILISRNSASQLEGNSSSNIFDFTRY